MSNARSAAGWSLGVVVIAVLVHVAAVYAWPRVIMQRVYAGMHEAADESGLIHAPRPDATSRTIVRPSPDLVYSVCAFDLDAGQWSIRAEIPDSYMSVSLYAMNTDNFFSINDRQVSGDRLDLRIVAGAVDETPVEGAPLVVKAPGPRGIALIRYFAGDGRREKAIAAARRTLDCGPAASRPEMLPSASISSGVDGG